MGDDIVQTFGAAFIPTQTQFGNVISVGKVDQINTHKRGRRKSVLKGRRRKSVLKRKRRKKSVLKGRRGRGRNVAYKFVGQVGQRR